MSHAAVIHAHVGHADQRARVRLRYRGAQSLAHGQGAAGVAGAVHGLGEEGVGLVAGGLHQHVVGFGHGNAELIDAHRLHWLAVGGDHRHLQAGDAHVEVGHGRAVDEAQADLLARLEQPGPVAVRRLAIEQVGVGGAAHVRKVGGAHLHFRPHLAVGHGSGPAVLADVIDEVGDGALVPVVVVRLLLQLGDHPGRVLVGPVTQHHHVVALVLVGLRLLRVDHDGAVHAHLFLQAGMAVVPVGAVLLHLEAVLVHAVRGDAGEAEARHAVHVGRQDHAVPVDGGVFVQAVAHPQGHGVAFAPAQQRAGEGAVDGLGDSRLAGEVHRRLADEQVELGAAEYRGLAGAGHRPDGRFPQPEATEYAAGGQALDEGPPRGFALHAVSIQSVERGTAQSVAARFQCKAATSVIGR
ncbi:hypothetical protein D9M70_303700 [compost metagenome]